MIHLKYNHLKENLLPGQMQFPCSPIALYAYTSIDLSLFTETLGSCRLEIPVSFAFLLQSPEHAMVDIQQLMNI